MLGVKLGGGTDKRSAHEQPRRQGVELCCLQNVFLSVKVI
jgi:hypothetical protein